MNQIAKQATIEGDFEVVETSDSSTLAALQSAEIDQQITTARAYPRSIKAFRHQAMEYATLDEATAGECMYSLPRGGKKITGPSARLAEIIASTWGNCRYGARIVEEQRDFVVAQGIFHDLEKNAFVSFEVKRRIVDSRGRRYNADMIGVTGNAACSIALRNAVFKGVPKALWSQIYEAAVSTAIGDERTLSQRRSMALDWFRKAGADEADIFATLEVADETEITLDHLAFLWGVKTSIKEGETSIDKAFKPVVLESAKRTLDLESGKIIDPLEGDDLPDHVTGKTATEEDEAPEQRAAQQETVEQPKDEAPVDTKPETEPETVKPDGITSNDPYANKQEVFDAMNAAKTPEEIDVIEDAANSCSWINEKGRKTSVALKASDLRTKLASAE